MTMKIENEWPIEVINAKKSVLFFALEKSPVKINIRKTMVSSYAGAIKLDVDSAALDYRIIKLSDLRHIQDGKKENIDYEDLGNLLTTEQSGYILFKGRQTGKEDVFEKISPTKHLPVFGKIIL
jgi:hypothetical protein